METRIRSRTSNLRFNLAELWRFRELFIILSWRDIKVRYKQTILGICWVIFQPLVTMAIFTVFFGKLANISSGDLPYPLFVFCGLVFWNFFSGALSQASNSLIDHESIITKVYFPKMILPISSVATHSVDFMINLLLLLLLAFFSGYSLPFLFFLILPLSYLLVATTTVGLGLLLSSINVKYRDVRYILPFFIQLLLFLTPVIYSVELVKGGKRLLLALNPLSGVIEATRSIIGRGGDFDTSLLVIASISALIILMIGILVFNSTERFFADII